MSLPIEVTEVKVVLSGFGVGHPERLRASCGVTLNGSFVVHEMKVIEGAKGLFVSMPSRKTTDHCGRCGGKNHLRSRYCNQCGCRQDENRAPRDADGRTRLHMDIAHPITGECRDVVSDAVLSAYEDELELSKLPGYWERQEKGGAA